MGLRPPPDMLAPLLQAWQEPQRHYHTLQHLDECLALAQGLPTTPERPGELLLALWFHDAVYSPRAHDNEARSADWAVRVLTAAGADPQVCHRVQHLILATAHVAPATEGAPTRAVHPDQDWLLDIDLAILGAHPERFAEYNRQVRAEYRWVPAPLYRHKRRQVLAGFLARPRLYATDHFHGRLEVAARSNLQAALA
ncbi:N-methyl-D-aspartate receptor NMDAR2C subunit [Ideonella sp. TBM-1]|uniref:N-methyl-D-aspartate receptor NMDAR2C subunit n=2 Tax=Ideonella livida TaxID=2707176 RepID=A0A7C9TNE5_9BURK|nr:N-methyl-D-aspartate receptor NMDAR2C subunit [Ideonella livida]